MKNFLQLLKLDVLQRVRTYRFFIMIAVGLYLAAGFVPAPDANYSTISLGDFRPVYNSVWVGALTAMMSSLLICVVGFFLIDGSMGKDQQLKINLFIKSGMISRRKYFLLKAWSNTALLCIIVLFIFVMAVVMYFVRRETVEFSLIDFLLPFAVVVIPSAIFTGHLSVILEALTGRYAVIRVVLFIFSLALIIPTMQNVEINDVLYYRDALGMGNFIGQIEYIINQEFGATLSGISMGYQFFDKSEQIDFVISAFSYPLNFVLSRLFIPAVMILLVSLSSRLSDKMFQGISSPIQKNTNEDHQTILKKRSIQKPAFKVTYSQNFLSLVLIEFKSLLKSQNRWLTGLVAALWISTWFTPTSVSHAYLLPLMVLFSSNKIAALGSRVYQSSIHLYSKAYSSFYVRQLLTHLVAVFSWLILLAIPLVIQLSIAGDFMSILAICTGLLFLVVVAQLLGSINKSGRLFEIILVLITYFLINELPWFDYLGAIQFAQSELLSFSLMGSIPVLWLVHFWWVKSRIGT